MEFSRIDLLTLEQGLTKRLKINEQQKKQKLSELFGDVKGSHQLSLKQLIKWYSHLSYLAFSPTQRAKVKAEQQGEEVKVKKQRNQYFERLTNNGNLGLQNIHD